MSEVLLVFLALALGGTLAFFLVCQHFRPRLEQLRQEKAALEAQVRELVQALATGRPST